VTADEGPVRGTTTPGPASGRLVATHDRPSEDHNAAAVPFSRPPAT
jgi:hypothetical protein